MKTILKKFWNGESNYQFPFSNFYFLFPIFILLASCSDKSSHQHDTYTCPMHPTVVSEKPGTCPVCGMDLVRKTRSGEEVEITSEITETLKSPNEVINSNIKTIKAEFKSVPVVISAQGAVTYDTRKVMAIPTRVGGRLEKVWLKYIFQPVTKGQKIAAIYSPELIAAQRELLYLLENDATNIELIESGKKKLQFMGVSSNQLQALIQRKEVTNTFIMTSPYNGYLIAADEETPTSAGSEAASGGMGMQPSVANSSVIETSTVNEGFYVTAGQTLFRLVNTESLRVVVDIPSATAGVIKPSDIVELDFGNDIKLKSSVSFVQPFFTADKTFSRIWVYVKNNDLQVGQLVNARIELQPRESLWLPRAAVVDMGIDKIVFIKERDVFKPHTISVGIESNGLVEIKAGLSSSDEVAANAQFLVDSESFVRKIGK